VRIVHGLMVAAAPARPVGDRGLALVHIGAVTAYCALLRDDLVRATFMGRKRKARASRGRASA
jgi:hypothetical protein